MIDYTQPVQTQHGHKVKLFTTEARDTLYPVVGEYFCDKIWEQENWTKDGLYCEGCAGKIDLVNIKPA